MFDPSTALYGMLHRSPGPWGATAMFIVLLFGGAIGSFVTAAARRSVDGRNVIGPRSACESCDAVLAPLDLIPLVGFFMLRGRCRHCEARLSRLEPLVEWLAALAITSLMIVTGGGATFWWGVSLLTILGIATITDLQTRRIPLAVSWSGIVAGLAWTPFEGSAGFLAHLLAVVATVGVLSGLNAFYTRVRNVDVAFGGGDVRLAGAIAAFVGPAGTPSALIVAATAGSVFGIVAILLGRATLRSTIPFGPFLGLGGALVVFGGPTLWGLLSVVN